jgi:glucosyl-3-phosphoglycerate synthase
MTTAPELTGVVTNENWLAERSWSRPTWTVAELEAAKAGRTVSVVLPALNEEETVASVIESISPMLGGLVDELVVLDSGSTDDTAIRALTAGARVVSREEALPELPTQAGKGEALWRSLAATSARTSSIPTRCSFQDWSRRCSRSTAFIW